MPVPRFAFRLAPFVAGAGLLMSPVPVHGQAKVSPAVPQAAAPTRGLRDKAELEAFLDGVMTADLAAHHVAGATVSVVKDGQLFFAKGYGYADVDQRKPVDPEKTMFRVGSISKLFTWTAVMQLVEQGKLDLNKDVNEYLDFKIPATFPQPITLTSILTHTPGLEEDGRDLFTEDPNHISPMSKWLPAHMPARVRPPGVYASYSNWATALAGYIVERVSGMPWEEYIEKHIYVPLGMTQTTVRQPLPAQFAADMSQGYRYAAGRFVPQKFEIVTGAAPAGSVSSSATDMAKFMIAHLNNGEYNGQRILSDASATLMHARLHGHDPRIPGFAHGFYEQSSHGLRLIGHGGDTGWFHSDLALLLSEKVGVFVSYNTDKGGELSFFSFLQTFLDHYYPEPPTKVATLPTAKADAKRVAGEYLLNRMSFTTYQKILSLAGGIPVAADSDGTIIVKSPFGDMRMVEVDTLLFRSELGGELLAFQADASGKVTHGFMSMAPMMVMDRQSALHSPRLHQVILIGGLLLYVGLLVAALVRVFHRPRTPGLPGRGLLVGVAAANVLFVLVLASTDLQGIFQGKETPLKIALVFPVIGALLTLGALWAVIVRWRGGLGTFFSRIAYTLAVLVALLFVWSLNTWNLLGWRM
ncbi:MAG: serine hydrolase domain-containing protein [Gemmatimonadota bacterium]